MKIRDFIIKLYKIGAIKFGEFTLKSGIISPFYIDLRDLVSYPELLEHLTDILIEDIKKFDFDIITGIPYTALPIASIISTKINKPLIYIRKEEKAYGTGKNIMGKFRKGDKCLVIDDLITTGESKIETAEKMEREGVNIKDILVVIDRSLDGKSELKKFGYNLHSLIELDEILELLQKENFISYKKVREVKKFTANLSEKGDKSERFSNIQTKRLWQKIQQKKSNLVLSLDVVEQKNFFRILKQVATEIVMLKTHIDILQDFDKDFITKLKDYVRRFDFFIFEDRKFADIGNTVRMQYRKGIYKISEWSDFITVHLLPGEKILDGLFAGLSGKSSFVLARMSSKGNLINETYTRKCFDIAKKHPEFISGFIGHGRDKNDIMRFKSKFPPGMLLLMPGVRLEKGTDKLGQQYLTVEEAIGGGADCIIVGRGIYQNDEPAKIARIYRQRAWKEFMKRM